MGGGQMVAADFVMTPAVVFSENNAGGIGGAVAGLLGPTASLGAVAGGLKFKEAQTSMLVADRAAACRSPRPKAARRRPTCGSGGRCSAAAWRRPAAGYGNTNEGKIIAAALMDNYNKVVSVVRDDRASSGTSATLKQEAAAGGRRRPARSSTKAMCCAEDRERQADVGRLGYQQGARDARQRRRARVIGGEKDGFINVQAATASGWVKIVLVARP